MGLKRFFSPDRADYERYKRLYPFLSDTTIKGAPASTYLNDPNDIFVLEKILGRHVTPDDFDDESDIKAPRGNITNTDALRRIEAYKTRKALAEYLLRKNYMHDPINAHFYPTDANTLAMLTITGDNIDDYLDNMDGRDNHIKEIFEQIKTDVPDAVYSEDDVNQAKQNYREEALDKAESAGVFDRDTGDKHHYRSDNTNDLYRELHPFKAWSGEHLITNEEKTALGDLAKLIGRQPGDE